MNKHLIVHVSLKEVIPWSYSDVRRSKKRETESASPREQMEHLNYTVMFRVKNN